MRPVVVLAAVALGACSGTSRAQVRPGIEVLLSDSAHLIRGRRAGLLTNHTGRDRGGRRSVDLLRAAPGARLTTLFSPEHGFQGREDRAGLPDGVDSASGLPVYSLYSGARPPNLAGLDSLDVLLVDLQDIGARYYTYVSSAAQLVREAAHRGIRVVVLDRPNPIGGTQVQGNVRAAAGDPTRDFVGFLPVPMRHGLTIGEMLLLANDVLELRADLVVVPAAGWRRDMWYDATGLPWVRPSPNMPDLESAAHYPGTCLFEGTNLSVGRGTDVAFQVVGAPWLEPDRVLERLRRDAGPALAGAATEPYDFTPVRPTDGKYDGTPLRGIRMRVVERSRYDPTRLAVALLAAIRAAHPDRLEFRAATFDRLAAGPGLRQMLLDGVTPDVWWRDWDEALSRYRARRGKYLLY
jgi:uncharacterized protein YbbC (DUF1343 family)